MNYLEYWNYTYEEMAAAAGELIAIQPIGSVEQHGPHLPLGTDSIICTAYMKALEERFARDAYPAVFLPLLPYGKSNEHLEFPGTITLSATTLMDVLMEVGESLARAGFKKMVFLNGHGGNHEILDLMCREIRIATGMTVFAVHPSLKIPSKYGHELELPPLGIHAEKMETSLIFHVAPSLVREEKYVQDYPTNFEGMTYLDFSERVPFGWMTQDVSKTGVIGDPAGATAAQGQRFLEGLTDNLVDVFDEIRRYA